MRTLRDRSRTPYQINDDDQGVGEQGPRWGLRSSYRTLTNTARFLNKEGPQPIKAIADHLINDSESADQPSPNRHSGMSSANQVVVTLSNLGLTERLEGKAQLTRSGHEFAAAIGSPDEERVFREILLGNEAFLWFWTKAAAGARTVARGELIRIASVVYPDYNPETRKTLAGVCLSYARHAGLVRKGFSGSRYSVSVHRLPELKSVKVPEEQGLAGEPGPALGSSVGEEASFTGDSLGDAGRLMGWMLAEEGLIDDEQLRQRVSHAFVEALAAHAGRPDQGLVRLAAHQAESALKSSDARLLRWAVRLVNGVLALDSRLPTSQEG